MAAIIVFGVLVAATVFVLVYSFVHKPKPGEYASHNDAIGWSPPQTFEPASEWAPRPEPSSSSAVAPVRAVPEPGRAVPSPLQPAPRPERVRHDVLSGDRIEHELLATLRERPSDEATRTVYADWLEQGGALAKANFVRGLDRFDEDVLVRDQTEFYWRAITCRDRIQCATAKCPKRWDAFEPVADDELTRLCKTCTKPVRYCVDLDEERASVARSERTLLDIAGALPARER
ncbi:MAG: hypothetical protein JWO36_3328 [Myxococcales bacterium]|nr:hypothetical protein [Myxococcales bacterium]